MGIYSSLIINYYFSFYDGFFQDGAKFLYRFALSLLSAIGSKILETSDPVKLFGYLRLDPAFIKLDFAEIIKGAEKFKIDITIDELQELRVKEYNENLKARMETYF